MKKIFAIICALCILIPACASACGGIAVKIETGNTYTGSVYVAMEQEQHLTGMLSETEKAEVYAAPRNIRPYVRGVVENGIVRAKGVLAYHEINGMVCGLTETGCTVTIYPEYEQAVAEIVDRRIGGETTVSAAAIIACTQWRTETTITQIFYTEKTAWEAGGSVFFDGPQYPASLCIGDCKRQHYRNFATCCGHSLIRRIKSSLGIESVKDCFTQKHIHTSLYKRNHLLFIGISKLIESNITVCRIFHIGAHGTCTRCRAYRTCHKARLISGGIFIGNRTSQFSRTEVYLTAYILATILCLRYTVGIESGCLDNVSPGSKIFGMYSTYHIRTRKHQNIIVAFKHYRMFRKPVATEIRLAQPAPLHHSTHGTVKHKYSLFQYIMKFHKLHILENIGSTLCSKDRATSKQNNQ
jgi:hypothetical protein